MLPARKLWSGPLSPPAEGPEAELIEKGSASLHPNPHHQEDILGRTIKTHDSVFSTFRCLFRADSNERGRSWLLGVQDALSERMRLKTPCFEKECNLHPHLCCPRVEVAVGVRTCRISCLLVHPEHAQALFRTHNPFLSLLIA